MATRVKLIKTDIQPGNNAIALIQAIGAQLAVINSTFVDAMGVSFTGSTLTSQQGIFDGISSEILNSSTGTINTLSTYEMSITVIGGYTGYIKDLTSDTSIVNNLNTESFFSGTGYMNNLRTNSVTGNSAYFDSFTGTYIITPLLPSISTTGNSAFFTTFTGINVYSNSFSAITGVYNSLYSQTGHFTNLVADDVLFNSNQSTKNYNVTDNITGLSMFITNMTGHNLFCDTITGSSFHFTTSLTGNIGIYTNAITVQM